MSKLVRQSFYVNCEGPNLDGIRKGILWLVQSGEAVGGEAWLVVNTYSSLEGVIREVLGDGPCKALRNKGLVRAGQVQVRCHTERTLPAFRGAGCVLVVHPDKKLLDRVDDLQGVERLCTIPWNKAEVAGWIETWVAQDVDGGVPTTAESPLSDLFRAALDSLTGSVNLGSEISHPSDKAMAVGTFRALRRNGEAYDASAMKTHFLRSGWSAHGANKVVDVADRIFAGRARGVAGCAAEHSP